MRLLKQLDNNITLTQSETTQFITYLTNPEINVEDKVDLLTQFTKKEIKQQELTYVVNSLIQTMYPNQPTYEGSICVCGTGGDKSNSFNISTTVSFIVASAGIPVIKHGSTDLLNELGIKTTKVSEVPLQIEEQGLAFISAMESYPIMKYIQPVRKMISTPTIFNIVGPLINPFKLTYQVLGVYDPSRLYMIAQTLKDLGRRRAIVLHGANGMDEATLSGNNEVYELNENGDITHYFINAKDYGLKVASNQDLQGGSPKENKMITLDILSGDDKTCRRDVVVLNAALALYVSEKVDTIASGISLATILIDSGRAMVQFMKMRGDICDDIK